VNDGDGIAKSRIRKEENDTTHRGHMYIAAGINPCSDAVDEGSDIACDLRTTVNIVGGATCCRVSLSLDGLYRNT
jgi:hypothetical protein